MATAIYNFIFEQVEFLQVSQHVTAKEFPISESSVGEARDHLLEEDQCSDSRLANVV